MRACARRENVEYELRAIHDAASDRVLDVLPLRWSELVVEDDKRRVTIFDDGAQLFDLPLAEIRRRVRSVDLLRQRPDDRRAGRVGETL